MRRDIHLGVLSPVIRLDRRWVAGILDLLSTEYPSLQPERYGSCDPLREVYDPSRPEPFVDMMMSSPVYWKRRSPRATGYWCPGVDQWIHSTLGVSADATSIDCAALKGLILSASDYMQADYAYAHEVTEHDLPVLSAADAGGWLNRTKGTYLLNITTHDLRRYIADLYWANVFGPPYVELFGKKRLLSAPAPVVRELKHGGIYIQLSESITDFHTDYERVNAVRQAVKLHLGCNAFFDISARPDHVYNTPEFVLLEDQEDQAVDGSRSANPPQVMNEMPKSVEFDPELLADVTASAYEAVEVARVYYAVHLDYSPGSIEHVEDILGNPGAVGASAPLAAKLGKPIPEDQLVVQSLLWGTYIGEVFRLQFGGTWYWERHVAPDPVMALRIGDTSIFPPSKVYKRLTQGEGDNVWTYFREICGRLRQEQK